MSPFNIPLIEGKPGIRFWALMLGGLLLAFAINAAAQRWQTAFHVRELEFCLREIDAQSHIPRSTQRRAELISKLARL